MGLFGNKKKEGDSEVTWEDIQRDMLTPGIPGELPEWFEKSAVDPTKLKHLCPSAHVSPDSWFNVETAAMFVGNRIPIQCEKCESESSCKSCGKNPKNYLKVMTANQDCDVLLWGLFSDERNANLGVADGGFIFFDQSVYPTLDTTSEFIFSSQDLAPVVIGEIEVTDMGDETGMLFFADANAHIDENFFVSNLKVVAGRHTVVAWMGYTNMGILAPHALGVYGPGLSKIMESDLKTALQVTPEIQELVEGSEDGTVLARMGNNQDYLAEKNEELFGEFSIAISWKLQLHMESNGENAIAELESQELECNRLLDVAFLLRIRGKRRLSDEVFNLVFNHPQLHEYEGLQELANKYKKLEPGFLPPMGAKFSAYRLYLEANTISESAGYERARELYVKAAQLGLTNALGTITWQELKSGNYAQGVKDYETLSKYTHKEVNAETLNCDSNYALLLLAVNSTIEESMKIWTRNTDFGHTDSIFFAALTLASVDLIDDAKEIASYLSKDQWEEMSNQMQQEGRTSTGWFKDWCNQGLDFIKEYKH